MSASDPTPRAWWRRAWVPGALVVLLAVLFLRVYAHLEVLQTLRFAAYVVGWLVLPGTVVWRLVDPRQREGRRPLGEDLALGALVGLVLEFPAYLLCLVATVPWLYAGWPLVWVVVLLALRGRRDVLHLGAPSTGRGWPWLSGLLVGYQVFWFARVRWGAEPLTDHGYARSYFDDYFHLGVVAALRRSWPPEYLTVSGTPIKYHWLSHLHVAASSYATGLEPAVLLHALSLPTVVVLSTVALARVAVRLTDAAWTGPVTLLGVVATSAAFPGWQPAATGMMSLLNLISPTAGFATAPLVLSMLVLVEALRAPRLRPLVVVTVGVLLFALFGAKSTSVPPLVAGLAVATVVGGLRDRGLLKRGAILTATGAIAFVAATAFFVGFGGSQGLEVHPLSLASIYVEDYLPASTQTQMPGQIAAGMSPATRMVAFSAVLGYLGFGLGQLCLLTRTGWRRPEHVFVVSSLAAGVGAAFTFAQIGHSERYFGWGMLPVLVLGAVLGLHRTCQRLPTKAGVRYAVAALLGGLVAGIVVLHVGRHVLPHRPTSPALHVALVMVAEPVALSLVLAAIVCLLASWGVSRLGSHHRLWRRSLPVTAVAALAGIGLTYPGMLLDGALRHPAPVARAGSPWEVIGPGGIDAARWVRAHTSDDTLVATNAHCLFLGAAPPCDARQFWMAAYAERPFLVEGWSFLDWSLVGRTQPAGTNTVDGPFWDPAMLAANDAAFDQPAPATVAGLRHRGVRWLLVDRRYRVDLPRLEQYADVEHTRGDYVVLRLR